MISRSASSKFPTLKMLSRITSVSPSLDVAVSDIASARHLYSRAFPYVGTSTMQRLDSTMGCMGRATEESTAGLDDLKFHDNSDTIEPTADIVICMILTLSCRSTV